MEVLLWFVGVIAFVVVLMVSVGLHEAGHMVVAKWFKLSVPKFFIGFGRTLWSKKIGQTEYGVKGIPLGGFVMIEDDRQEEKAHERMLLSHVSPWKRILIYAAGPAVNIFLGVAIIFGVLVGYPQQYVSNTIEKVDTCQQVSVGEPRACGAAESGIQAGDTILKIDGADVKDRADIAPMVAGKTEAVIVVDRGGEQVELLTPISNGTIGVNMSVKERHLGAGEAVERIGFVLEANVDAVIALPSKIPGVVNSILGAQPEPDAPGSVVSAGKSYGDTAADVTIHNDDKVRMLITYSGLLNLALGMINLVPLLPLDGGRMVVALLDSIKMAFSKISRRDYNPVGMKFMNAFTATTGLAVVGFMGLIIIADIVLIARGLR